MKKIRLHLLGFVCMVVVGTVMYGCTYYELDQQNSDYGDFSIQEARQFFEENATDLKNVDFSNLDGKNPKFKSSEAVLSADWLKAKIMGQDSNNAELQTIEIPLVGDVNKSALISEWGPSDGRLVLRTRSISKLVIEKNCRTGAIRQFIATMILNRTKTKKPFRELDMMNLDYCNLDGFSGLIITSSLDGVLKDCYQSTNGSLQRMYILPYDSDKAKDKDNLVLTMYRARSSKVGYTVGEGGPGYDIDGGTFDPVIVSPTDGGGGTGGGGGGSGGGGTGGGGSGGGGSGGGGMNPPKPTTPDYTKPPTTPKKPLDGECFCVRGTPGQGVKGGLYGAGRGVNRKHQGIDLGVNIGKPVYAAFSGTITKLVTEQPNRVPEGQRTELHNKETGYPLTYKGDRNAAGNRIRIYSDINGTKFETTYMHLDQGNRHNLKNGGRVNAGDIIGYTGISGNSYPNSPVLHLQTNKDRNYGQHFDPAIFFPFINKTGTCGSPNCINKK